MLITWQSVPNNMFVQKKDMVNYCAHILKWSIPVVFWTQRLSSLYIFLWQSHIRYHLYTYEWYLIWIVPNRWLFRKLLGCVHNFSLKSCHGCMVICAWFSRLSRSCCCFPFSPGMLCSKVKINIWFKQSFFCRCQTVIQELHLTIFGICEKKCERSSC